MKKRIRLKKEIKLDVNRWNISLILIIFFMFFWFHLLNKEASPILLSYAELETTKLATLIINKAVSNQVSQELTVDDLIITSKNKNDEIESVDFNQINVNKILNTVTNVIEENLKLLENGSLEIIGLKESKKKYGIIYEIPFGVIFKNPVIADLGPKIPVKTKMIGSVISNVHTKITDYGINSAMIEVSVDVEVSERVILPFLSKRITIRQGIPIMFKVLQGTVPKYYAGSMSKNSPLFSIPLN